MKMFSFHVFMDFSEFPTIADFWFHSVMDGEHTLCTEADSPRSVLCSDVWHVSRELLCSGAGSVFCCCGVACPVDGCLLAPVGLQHWSHLIAFYPFVLFVVESEVV